MKGSNSGTAGDRGAQGKAWGKRAELPRPLQAPLSPNLHAITNAEALQSQYFRVLTEASLHGHH